jgi:uncharacterized OsmC-like protein
MSPTQNTDRIRTAFERNSKAVSLRAGVGQKTVTTRVRVVDGLRCEIEEGRWTVVADASEKSGGTAGGPDPGVLGRAALGSCLAMGYVMWAAHLEVPLDSVSVELESDFDSRGQYGLEGVPPGHSEIRYLVRIESSAPEADVRRVVESADAASMFRDDFANPRKLERRIEITRPG